MKKHYILAISLLLVAPLLAVGSLGAIANEDGSPAAPPAEGEFRITNTAEETNQVDETADKKQIEDRIDKRRVERNFRIPYADQVRTKERCKGAQARLSLLGNRIKGIETSRSEKYTNLVNRLNNLAESLKEKEIDTTNLEVQVAALQAHIDAFDTELAAYKLVVSDLSLVDCQQVPVGFRASIEAARESRASTAVASAAIKTYLQETIKPSLQQLRSQLNATQATGQEN